MRIGDDPFLTSCKACPCEPVGQPNRGKFVNSYASCAALAVFTLLASFISFSASAEDDYERAAKAGSRHRMALIIGNSTYLAEPQAVPCVKEHCVASSSIRSRPKLPQRDPKVGFVQI